MKKIYEYLFVVGSIFLVLLFLFNKFIYGDFVFMSGDSLAPQAIKQSLYNIKSNTGLFPYWFPYIFSGMPTIHSLLNINEYYLPHLVINYLHDFGMPWFWNFIFHYLFAGLGMYNFIRYLKQPKSISIFVSILFSISPYMIAYLVHGHGSQMMTASYIPWIMLFLFKIYKKTNFINFSILALLVGLQLQRGHVQIVYYTWLMMGFYILINGIFYYLDNKKEVKSFLYKNVIILLSLFLGFLTALKIYLPVLNYSDYSTRGSELGGLGIENATQWSLHFKESLTFILPYAYGFGGQNYWGFLPMTDFPNYIGIIILFLAVIGLIKSDLTKETKTFFLVLIIFSFLLSLGKNLLFFYKIFYNYLPYFNKFRVPIFIMVIMQFCIYVLAGCGLNKLPGLIKNKIYNRRIIFGLITLISLFTINSFIKPNLYQSNRYGIEQQKEEKIFNNIKNQYSHIIANNDLNKDGKYNNIDKNIFEQWIDSDVKLLKSQLLFQQSNQTKEQLILILESVNDSTENLVKQFKRDHFYIISILLIFLLITFLYAKYSKFKDKHYIFLISFLLIIDYMRVDLEIIQPNEHIPNREIVKESRYLNKYLEPDEVVDYLLQDRTKFRLLDLTNLDNMNRWAAFNLETINGYHPAKLNFYNEMLNMISEKGGAYPYGLLQSLNIKYILHTQRGRIPNFNLIDKPFKYLSNNISDQDYIDTYIYKNESDIGRIFIVNNIELINYDNEPPVNLDRYIDKKDKVALIKLFHKKTFYGKKEDYLSNKGYIYDEEKNIYYEKFNNDEIILHKITSQAFDPIRLSYINQDYLELSQIENLENLEKSSNSSINLINWQTDEIMFETDFDKPQLVCLSEIFYPGWSIQQEDIDIINVNGLFRGAILPKGKNVYTMKFKPSDLSLGLLISKFSYFIILSLFLYGLYRRKYAKL